MVTIEETEVDRVVQETGIARLELERRLGAGEVRVAATGVVPREEVTRLRRERTTPGLTVEEAAAVLGHKDTSYTYRRIREGALPAWAEEKPGGLVYKLLPPHIEWFSARHRLSGEVIPARAVAVPTAPPPPPNTMTIGEAMAALGTTSRSSIYSLLARGRLTRAHDTTRERGNAGPIRITSQSVKQLAKERREGRTPVGGYRPAKDAPAGRRYRVPGGQAAYRIRQQLPIKSGEYASVAHDSGARAE
jgi:hypothetical protein